MNRNWIRRIVILVVFIVSLVVFSMVLNQGNTDMTVEMTPASMPIASILIEDQKVNEMHGFSQRMDAATMRDSVTPIGDDRSLCFQIDLYGQKMKELRFEVRSVDGERLIEDTRVTDYMNHGNTITATVSLKDLIEKGVEYNLILAVTLEDNREIYYYTRVVQCDNAFTKEKLDYVLDFHEKTFDKESSKELSIYLEPNSDGDNSNFGKVDIHSNLNQVSWGDLNITQVEEPTVYLCELSQNLASVRLDSIVGVWDGKISNFYRVQEYYRIRYTKERFYLLNYDRTMEELFPMDKSSFANNKIILGIQKDEIHMAESDGGNILAFANAGRIYCYDVSENKLSQLFSFFDENNFDARTYYDMSDVKILDVEENGNVAFIVYGYMNRGSHEGEVGVELCYYNHLLNTTEEQVFIAYDKSPQILIKDIERLAYVNRRGDFFALIDGAIYKVNIETKNYEVIASGLNEDNFYVSKNNKMVVWQEKTTSAGATVLTLMNLNTEEVSYIQAGAGEYCKAIGFMNEDLIYGLANMDDVKRDCFGTYVLPLKELRIQSDNGSVLKKYQNEGVYILGGEINGNQLNLTRAKGERDEAITNDAGELVVQPLELKPIEDDQITSNVEENEGENRIVTVVTDLYETIQQIELKKEIDVKRLKFLTPKEVLYEGARTLELDDKECGNRYLVYTKGRLSDIYADPGKAVLKAYEQVGTVMDCHGNEIYCRGEIVSRNQIMAIKEIGVTKEKDSMAICLDTILQFEGISRNTENMLQQGENAEEILSSNLKNCDVLNLTGCTMDSMLYYVNQDIPVLAMKDSDSAVLIIGFNQQNVVLLDPENGKIFKKGMNDSREMFEKNGNGFMTYVRNTDG